MAYELSMINAQVRADPTSFLQKCDAQYDEKVERAAATIAARRKTSPIVLLSGPSGSGKTTTALKLEDALRRCGIKTYAISMDNYFTTINPETAPRTETGDIDFESPQCLDIELLQEHFSKLANGEEIFIPKFEFARNMRNDSKVTPLRLGRDEVAIFEGIHALRDEISDQHPEAVKLYISASSNIESNGKVCFKGTWMRLVRRAVRDYQFRGSDVGFTFSNWANVRNGEKLHISPYKYKADIRIDSTLPYEVSVMKAFAMPLLQAVPEGNERREEILHLMSAFQQFESIDPDLVPKSSLLREFIGGGQYFY